jgi:hypothetical protein
VGGPIFALFAAWLPAARTTSMSLTQAIADD